MLYQAFSESSSGPANMQYQPTSEHRGDMFTKRFEPNRFEAALGTVEYVGLARPCVPRV